MPNWIANLFRAKDSDLRHLSRDGTQFDLRPRDVLGNMEFLRDGERVELARALIDAENQRNRRTSVTKNLIVIGSIAAFFAVVGLLMLFAPAGNESGATQINLLGLFKVSTQTAGVGLLGVAATVAIYGRGLSL